MPPPYVAVQNVKGAERPPTLSPSQLNARLLEVIAPQQAPDKPRQGDVPCRPSRMPMYSVLAKREKRAVMADAQSGVMGKTEFMQLTSTPRGKSLSWDERVNIRRGTPEAYGSRFQVAPQQLAYEAQLQAMMGV